MDALHGDRRPGEADSPLIEAVVERVWEQLPAEQAPACAAFVRQLFRWVPAEDLAGRSALDLYGTALAGWRLMAQRGVGQAAIRVYNPHLQRDGWQSTHTVVEIVSDDMPFLVDSITILLGRREIGIHLMIHPVVRVRRDAGGQLLEILPPNGGDDTNRESVVHAEVDRETSPERLWELERDLAHVIAEVHAAVSDWQPMRRRLHETVAMLARRTQDSGDTDLRESAEYLGWLDENHFTFLGYQEYAVSGTGEDASLRALPDSALGVLREDPVVAAADRDAAWTQTIGAAPGLLVLAKASMRANVHRPSYLDYVGVRLTDADGRLIGERRFLGLYTTRAYWERTTQIPILRGKVDYVLERAGFARDSHDRKALVEILEGYPRDELVQIHREELFSIAMGILAIGERQRVRLFIARDEFKRFVSCLVFLPRDRFNTANRQRVAGVLADALDAEVDEWTLLLSESVLVRIHYLLRTVRGAAIEHDAAEIEARLVAVTTSWTEDLREALVDELGEEAGLELHERYGDAFPAGYRDDWAARVAVTDIRRAESLERDGGLAIVPYRPLESANGALRCKLFSAGAPMLLSDALPIFENMGARITDERPYEITPRGRAPLWLYDFGFALERPLAIEADEVRGRFEEAFVGIWRGTYENDQLNRLVLDTRLGARDVTILRAIGSYLRQGAPMLGESSRQRALTTHPEIAEQLVSLFRVRFDPLALDADEERRLEGAITTAIDDVASLDDDRVLRGHLAAIMAITRTDHYLPATDGAARPSLAFKLDPQRLPLLPAPRPRFEIFVYSPRLEGVHLRGGRVARGGLRWSDRRDDYRTEVLGLMKAQTVKNAVIAPVGAKGGFVVKQPPAGVPLRDEVVACYRIFVESLLGLTDNVVGGATVVPPPGVIRHDADDPYLVVAADKGTATFSDIANEIATARGFWLGDAFASGGSSGYDHKRMGITARGAWEGVRRHFRELGVDILTADFTVAGIGDMSGDVFGNGMLLSRHIKLIGAFNHAHVFLDPDPDPAASYAERARLFALERSTWSDYDAALISDGGGVYARSAKSIELSPRVRAALAIEDEQLTPDELIRALLRAPVDLLWSAGIGTYVKATSEAAVDVGDRANDGARVNGSQLRCRVVGEGGNLGLTQRGRVEYALAGGRVNTDAIDNVGGVNCSDREVNVKILLDAIVASGAMSRGQRDELLAEMTEQVAALVLRDSYTQTQCLGLAASQAAGMLDVHTRLIRSLEQTAALDRALESLPSDDELAERALHDRGLTSPELAVLLAHVKIGLHSALLESDLPDEPFLADELRRYFPAPLPERFADEIQRHPLRREIVTTHLTNDLVDYLGLATPFTLGEESGAPASQIAGAYATAREVFAMGDFWSAVESLDGIADAEAQAAMLLDARALLEHAIRWIVRNCRPLDVGAAIDRYRGGAAALGAALPAMLDDADRDAFEQRAERLAGGGVPAATAERAAAMGVLGAALDIVEITTATGMGLGPVTATYFQAGGRLSLHWLRDRIAELPRSDRWQVLARAGLLDDVAMLQRALTTDILRGAPGPDGIEGATEHWAAGNAASLERYLAMVADIRASRAYTLTTLPVALRELSKLVATADAGWSPRLAEGW